MALQSEETRALVQFGKSERIHLEKIRDDFQEKGSFGLRWDSIVSVDERRAWWYLYLFTFRKVDKTEVINEIEKYIKLYGHIENIQSLTFEQIEAMEDDVKQALTAAKTELRSTNSSAVYKMCQTLVSSKIDKDIEKIKSAVGAQEYKKLKNNFEKMVEETSEKCKKEYEAKINDLKENIKKKDEEHSQTVEKLAQGISMARSSMEDYEAKINDLNENIKKKDEEHSQTVEKLEQSISMAGSRMQDMEKVLALVVNQLAKKDDVFLVEMQRMLLENQKPVIEASEPLVAIEYPEDDSIESKT